MGDTDDRLGSTDARWRTGNGPRHARQARRNDRTAPPDPDAPRHGPSLSYVPALDGVRAVAIVVTMGYHGGVFFTSGGFYGVDTFFALSGFLITSLLLTEWRATATVRLRAFWARRARRLLPGLLVMVGAVAVLARLLVPGTYTHLRADSLATVFYVANWHFIAIGSNYFAQTGVTSPLTHTWSLAVEEQFYLVWPLVVLGVFKLWRSTGALLVVCAGGMLASSVEMAVLYSPAAVNRLYYGTDTRAQSVMVGATLAVGLSMWADRRRTARVAGPPAPRRTVPPGGDPAWALRSPVGRSVAVAVGLAGAIASVALWHMVSANDAFAYRGGFLVAAAATAAVIFSVVCVQRSLLARCLSVAPVRYLGRISYGMYLWHFPIFLYMDGARTGLTGYPLFAVRSAATLAVATASFYLVERPVRQGTFLSGWRVWLAAPAAMAGTAAVVAVATALPTVAVGVGPGTPDDPAHAGAPTASATASAPTAPVTHPPGPPPPGPGIRVLLVGDSTAFTLAIGLSEPKHYYHAELYDGGILGCGVTDGAEYRLQGVEAPFAAPCTGSSTTAQWPQLWQREIARDHPNVVMILAGRWEVTDRTYQGRWTNIEDPAFAAYVGRQLRQAVRVAGSGGAHVDLLTAPCYQSGEQPDGAPWPEDSPARLAVYNRLVREVAATSADTSLIDLNQMACPGGHYEEYMDGVQVRGADGVHFTLVGGEVFASKIWPTLVAQSHQQMAAHAGPAGTR